MQEQSLEARALTAYFRASLREVGLPSLDPRAPGVARRVELNGLSYVVLSNRAPRVVAVYRILPSGGLKRLRRWPKELA